MSALLIRPVLSAIGPPPVGSTTFLRGAPRWAVAPPAACRRRHAHPLLATDWEGEEGFHVLAEAGFQVMEMEMEMDDELETLVDSWREGQAVADETGGPPTAAQQQAALEAWRQMLSRRESELMAEARAGGSKSGGWVPAALTGWYEEEGGDDDEEVVTIQRPEEGADEADEAFVLEWQLHAERQRQQEERDEPVDATAARRPAAPRLWGRGAAQAGWGDGACVGIDLGTTNCAVAVVVDGRPVVLRNDEGAAVTPSTVSFLGLGQGSGQGSGGGGGGADAPEGLAGRGRVLVGEKAQRQEVTNPTSTYSSTKRLIGRTASADELRALSALDVPARLTRGTREVLLPCPALRTTLSPIDVSAELLRAMRQQAEAALGGGVAVNKAVVTVPAYFDDSQRAATETACVLAGIETVQLLREPEAAALTYAIDAQQDERIMVFDLGGGTFDVSILDVGGGVVEVVATSGDPRVGGNDWDHAIAAWLSEQFLAQHGVPLRGFAHRRLLDAAVEAKHRLSTDATTLVEVPFLDGELGLNVTLSRRKFEALCRPLLLKLVSPMQQVFEVAGLELQPDIGTLSLGDLSAAAPSRQKWSRQVAWRWQRMAKKLKTGAPGVGTSRVQRFSSGVPVSRVLLVGGATRMPSIGRFIKRLTGLKAKPVVDPEEAVALGAATFAGILAGAIDQKVFNPFFHDQKLTVAMPPKVVGTKPAAAKQRKAR